MTFGFGAADKALHPPWRVLAKGGMIAGGPSWLSAGHVDPDRGGRREK